MDPYRQVLRHRQLEEAEAMLRSLSRELEGDELPPIIPAGVANACGMVGAARRELDDWCKQQVGAAVQL